MNTHYVLAAMALMAAVTIALRAVPFLLPQRLFSRPLVQNIAKIMPLLIMVTLVAHSFQNATWHISGTAPALVFGILATGLMQYYFKIPLISILVGLTIHIGLLNLA